MNKKGAFLGKCWNLSKLAWNLSRIVVYVILLGFRHLYGQYLPFWGTENSEPKYEKFEYNMRTREQVGS